jgi:protoheme IX farnesyltransferase
LPASGRKDSFVARQSLLATLVLFLMALVPAIRGDSGIIYLAGGLVLGCMFLYYNIRFAFQRSAGSARQLLLASIVYLPALFALLAMDKK